MELKLKTGYVREVVEIEKVNFTVDHADKSTIAWPSWFEPNVETCFIFEQKIEMIRKNNAFHYENKNKIICHLVFSLFSK